MRNELFTIGPLTVYGYGFMIAVGVIAGMDYYESTCKETETGS